MISVYSKSIAFLIATAFGAVIAANTDGDVSVTEWVNVLIAVVGAALVYLVPNLPDGIKAYAKTFVAAIVAGLTVLASALISGGIETNEWLQIGMAILGALGVFIVPNATPSLVHQIRRAADDTL
jgi:drug/metabolite transporter (DMT)-like permease